MEIDTTGLFILWTAYKFTDKVAVYPSGFKRLERRRGT